MESHERRLAFSDAPLGLTFRESGHPQGTLAVKGVALGSQAAMHGVQIGWIVAAVRLNNSLRKLNFHTLTLSVTCLSVNLQIDEMAMSNKNFHKAMKKVKRKGAKTITFAVMGPAQAISPADSENPGPLLPSAANQVRNNAGRCKGLHQR